MRNVPAHMRRQDWPTHNHLPPRVGVSGVDRASRISDRRRGWGKSLRPRGRERDQANDRRDRRSLAVSRGI